MGNIGQSVGMALSPAYMIYNMFTNKPPSPRPPPPAPDPNDPKMLNSQRQKIASAAQTGRAGTILSGPSNDYSSPHL